MIICYYSRLFDKTLSFGKDLTIWAAISMAKKGLEETSNRFSDCHLDIGAHLNIANYSNIAGRIFKSVKPSKENDESEESQKQCKKVLGSFPFLVTISSSAAQVPLL